MTDENDPPALARETFRLQMDFGDERAGSVDYAEATSLSVLAYLGRHPVGREDTNGTLGNFGFRFHKDCAALLELRHYVPVVNDLLPHINRRTQRLERAL